MFLTKVDAGTHGLTARVTFSTTEKDAARPGHVTVHVPTDDRKLGTVARGWLSEE